MVAANAHRGLRVRQAREDKRMVAERRQRNGGFEEETEEGGRAGGREGRPSQATASRHNSELPRCEGRIDSIALTLYAPALCIYVNA